MEGEEHDGAVGQVCDEVIVPTCCNGRVQEGSGSLGSGGLHPVVVPELKGGEKMDRERVHKPDEHLVCPTTVELRVF